ncbi:MAG TPA: hypothetical protein VG710_11315 [Opitutus sp.]|nr:hypothetical protein [Opitutus sp.]
MRFFSALLILSMAAGLAGCDSIEAPPSWHERFSPEPQVRTYAGEQQAVFEAARAALRQIDFTITRSRAAQGVLEAHSALHAGNSFQGAQQFSMSVKVQASDEPGKTDVSVLLREQEESSFGGATEVPVGQHGLYDSFFAALEQALSPKPAK